LVAGARIPLELNVDQARLAVRVDLDDLTSNQLADRLESARPMAAGEEDCEYDTAELPHRATIPFHPPRPRRSVVTRRPGPPR
jgi:hypothetical protein